MGDIFTTREIAVGIWLSTIIIFAFILPTVRVYAVKVVKTFCSPVLFIPFMLMVIYASVIVFGLIHLSLWNWIYLKSIVIWVILAGIPNCYKAIEIKANSKLFRNMIFDNLKFIVIINFIVSNFTFHLIAEIILLPAIAFIVMFHTLTTSKPEYAILEKITSVLITIVVIIYLGFIFLEAIKSYRVLGTFDSLINFMIPIVFSTLFLPLAYGMAIYSKYQSLFTRIRVENKMDKKKKRQFVRRIIKVCGISINNIDELHEEYIQNRDYYMKQDGLENLINHFKSRAKGTNE